MANSRRTRTRGRRREDSPLYRLVFPMIMGLALAGALVVGYQLIVTYQARTVANHLDRTAEWVQQAIADAVAERRDRLSALTSVEWVHRALEAETVPPDASRQMASRFPQASAAGLLLATVDERDVTGFPGLDYAALDLIWDFLEQGQSPIPAEVHLPGTAQAHLVVIEPVFGSAGETLLGFIRVAWPAGFITEIVDQADVPAGYLAVVQGQGGYRDHEIHAVGSAPGTLLSERESRPIPGTGLHVAVAQQPAFLPLGGQPMALLWAGFIFCVLVFVVATWLRFTLPGIMDRAQARRDKGAPVRRATDRKLGLPPSAATGRQRAQGVELDQSLFRAYDIRGIVGETLTRDAAIQIGRAIGSEARKRRCREVVVGRDGRDTGPEIAEALIEGLLTTGSIVIDIGAVPTPVLYYATHQLRTNAGVMVTGSHNPPEYNGFKIVLGGETLSGDAIGDLHRRIAEADFEFGEGQVREESIVDEYIERIMGDIQLQRPIKVVADAGNGIAGNVAPRLLKAVGAEVVPLYCDVDGQFPNHHPDPSVPENLEDLIATVKETGADLGFAYDGDGDRLGVVTANGENIYPDRLMMLFARDVLTRNPGGAVIFDVKCSGRLTDEIIELGGSPIMWKTGHSLIKAKLKETGALLAGEMSGHFFFTERWYGFDDALYAGCRLLEILAGEDESPSAVLERLPTGVSTPELKVHMAEGEHFRFLEKFRQQANFEDAQITTTDGIRADFPSSWGLVRCSNTTPCLVLRFEGDDEEALARVKEAFRRQLLAVDPDLDLPF